MPQKCSGRALLDSDPTKPSSKDVLKQLELILASAEFKVSDRIRRFLIYVTNETLAGRVDRIKAYPIATEVLGRDPNFDVQNDPVVRIEAGRLRRAIERYYFVAGQSDRVLIEIPKGAYVPHFSWRPDLSSEPEQDVRRSSWPSLRSRWMWAFAGATALVVAAVGFSQFHPADQLAPPVRPALVVTPFANLSPASESGLVAAGMTEEVLMQLARFKEISVY